MRLSLEELTRTGGFAGGMVKRELRYDFNGDKICADVWVAPLSYETAMQDAMALKNGVDLIANRIASSIFDEEGKPIFTVPDITGIDKDGNPIMIVNEDGEAVPRGKLGSHIADPLCELIAEVSALGKNRTL